MKAIAHQHKKTRFAPTPSGFLHLGNVLSLAITAALAEQTSSRILLRIDDLDRERTQPEYVRDIFETLNFMEIAWDEGPGDEAQFENEYAQLHRMPLYNNALTHLANNDHVFACTCSRSEILRQEPEGIYPGTCIHKDLPLDTPGCCWRLRTPDIANVRVNAFNKGTIATQVPKSMRNCIVRKKDGYPAYQLNSIIDDIHFGVDFIVRGQDLWESTLAQLHLSELFGENSFRNNTFLHHPLLIGADGSKLSKSAGATSIQYLRKQGLLPADIYALIGSVLNFKSAVSTRQELTELVFLIQISYSTQIVAQFAL